MNKIAQFHKVSFEQFKESWDDSFPGASEEEIKELEYILKELEGLPGYLPFEEKIEIDASYTDPKLEVISIQKEVENQPTKVEITKTDITGEKEVEGLCMH